jgi:sensor domain CHASE-containing protein
MSLRRKTLVTTTIALAAAIVFSLIVSQTILMRRFDELEKRETSQNVGRAVSALYSDFSKISIAWGNELTASNVIIDGNQTYLALSIDQTTFSTLGLNYILFVTPELGPIPYGDVPADLMSQLAPDSPLMQPEEGQVGVTGILMLPT